MEVSGHYFEARRPHWRYLRALGDGTTIRVVASQVLLAGLSLSNGGILAAAGEFIAWCAHRYVVLLPGPMPRFLRPGSPARLRTTVGELSISSQRHAQCGGGLARG